MRVRYFPRRAKRDARGATRAGRRGLGLVGDVRACGVDGCVARPGGRVRDRAPPRRSSRPREGERASFVSCPVGGNSFCASHSIATWGDSNSAAKPFSQTAHERAPARRHQSGIFLRRSRNHAVSRKPYGDVRPTSSSQMNCEMNFGSVAPVAPNDGSSSRLVPKGEW